MGIAHSSKRLSHHPLTLEVLGITEIALCHVQEILCLLAEAVAKRRDG